MTYKFGKTSLDKLDGVHQDLEKLCHRALALSPIDFVIVQGARTQEYQDQLYAQGRTKPGPVVTWTRNSRHIGGFAIDFAAWTGKIDWNAKYYAPIAGAFKAAAKELNIPIVCGIDWKTPDYGHVELSSAVYPAEGK